jgi:hypothetical protein
MSPNSHFTAVETGSSSRSSLYPPRLLTVDELRKIPPPKFIINTMMLEEGIYVLGGAPGVGKSLLEIHLSMSIGLGRNFHGRSTTQGDVIRIIAERVSSNPKRLDAWAHFNDPGVFDRCQVPLRTWPAAVNLLDEYSLNGFVAAVRASGVAPRLLVIDTLIHCAPSMNENAADQMHAAFEGAGFLRDALGCAVLVLHHTGKDGKTIRGSSSLEAYVDGLWVLSKAKNDALVLRCIKDNHARSFEPQYFVIREFDETAALVEPTAVPVTSKQTGAAGVNAAQPMQVSPGKTIEERIVVLLQGCTSLNRASLQLGLEADGGHAYKKTTVSNVVKRMLGEGQLLEDTEGQLRSRPAVDAA